MSSPENHPPAGTRATKSPADGFSRRTKIHEGHDVQVYLRDLRTLRDFVMIQTGAALAAFALQGGVGLTGVDLFQRQRSIRRHVAQRLFQSARPSNRDAAGTLGAAQSDRNALIAGGR